ncbi:MAG: ATP-binding protein [Acidobacteriota bacterium]|nr:ATP-binding protein [Acidobacteriota bacterium]
MLRDLKVQYKILLFPMIALVFFLLSYAMTRFMAQRNDALTLEIENKHVPTMELNRALEYLLTSIRQALQDAASIGDIEPLKEADDHADSLLEKIAGARDSSSIDPAILTEMQTRFTDYYERARPLTLRLIQGDTTGVAFNTELQQLTDDYNNLDAFIKQSIKAADLAAQGAFTRTRESHRRFMKFSLAGTIVSVLLLLILSFILGRSMTVPLAKVVRGLQHFTPGSSGIDDSLLGRDEIGELARAFNHMAAELRDTTVSKDYIESIIGSMNDALFVISHEGRVNLVNDAALLLLGYNEEELTGRPLEPLLARNEATSAAGLLEQVQKHAITNLEVSLRAKNGQKVLVSLSGSAIWDERKEFRGMIILTRDQREIRELIDNLQTVTKEQAEQNWIKTNVNHIMGLAQGRARPADLADAVIRELTPLIEGGFGLFYLFERQGAEFLLSPQGCYAIGKEQCRKAVFKPGEGQVGQCALEKKAILLGDIPPGYIRIASGLGRALPRVILFQPILFEGEVKGVLEIGSFKEFTPTQRAFLDQLSDQLGVIIDSTERRLQTERLLSETQLLAEALKKRTHETELQSDKLKAANMELARRAVELERTQQELVQKAHQAGMAEIAVSVLHNVGNILNSVITSSEFVRRKLNNSKLRSLVLANELLRQNRNRLGEFMEVDPKGLQLVNHLTKLEKNLTKEREAMHADICRVIDKTQLIRDVIMAQQDYASGGFQSEALCLQDAVEDALKIQEIDIQTRGILVEKHFQPAVPKIMLQRTKLIHILVNIFKNAAEAMIDEKKITIFVNRDEHYAFIKISDTGHGIPKENLEAIFSHGFTTKTEGHGFGLHSCANAMVEMNGQMWAESKGPGTGATFILKFPLASVTEEKLPQVAGRV